ncbi:hypothetical protein GCM10025794_07150 [Massilia kyonggiensis]
MEKKRFARTAIACALMALAGAARADVGQRVEALLRQMTLEEKIGQLNQLSGKDFSTGPGTDKVRDIERDIREGRIGSMLNIRGAAETRRVQALALQSRLHIPLLFGLDVIHGYRTVFPVPLGEAASWDLDAIEESARIAAREASAAGVHWTFAPMVDIGRDPRWGRVMEGAGEDTYLGSRIAAARVRGFQGAKLGGLESVMATAKHFAGYGAAIAGRDYNAVDMSEHQLHDYVHGPVFRRHFQPHVWIRPREARGQRAHRRLREQQRGADAQAAARPVAARGEGGRRLVDLCQQGARPFVQRASFLRELQRARPPFEQAQAQIRFQLRDSARQGRLRPARLARGAAEAAVAGDEVEIGEGKQVHVFHLRDGMSNITVYRSACGMAKL